MSSVLTSETTMETTPMPDNSTHHRVWMPGPIVGRAKFTFHGQIHEVRTVYVPVVVGGPGGPHGMLRA